MIQLILLDRLVKAQINLVQICKSICLTGIEYFKS